MKNNNYITIQGWMVNDLKLYGNELVLYSLIFGFSQDGKSGYEGGGKYLQESCGVSRRTITLLLAGLLKKEYILKEYFTKNKVLFCRYKTNPEFIPKEKTKDDDSPEQKRDINDAFSQEGGMANSATGYGKNCHRGMANSAMGYGKNCHGGMANSAMGYGKNCHGGMAKIANNIDLNINLNTTTTADPDRPDLCEEALAPDKTAASDLSPENIKKAILEIDRSVLLKADFYTRAAAFMALHYLDKNYLAWLYKQVELRNPDNFDGFFFTLFFAENIVEKYKMSKTPPQPPPPTEFKCPVCGTVHNRQEEACPSCSLPKDASSSQIETYRSLLSLPKDRRNEYLKKENEASLSCKNDFIKFKAAKDSLKKEFGLEAAYETSSRSYHP